MTSSAAKRATASKWAAASMCAGAVGCQSDVEGVVRRERLGFERDAQRGCHQTKVISDGVVPLGGQGAGLNAVQAGGGVFP